MKRKKHFLAYAGVTDASALVEQSRAAAQNLREQGYQPSAENRLAMIDGEDGPELIIYGRITPFAFWDDEVSSSQVMEELQGASGKDLTVRINSPGGSVREGVAIFNLLKKHKGQVTCVVDGMAGSIASIILMAGEKRIMGEGSQVMIHNALSGLIGNAADLRHEADILDQISGQLADIYARRTNLSRAEIKAAMDAETYYTETDAVEAGFAHEVSDLPEPAPEPSNFIEENDPPAPDPEPEPVNLGTVADVIEARERVATLAAKYGITLSADR